MHRPRPAGHSESHIPCLRSPHGCANLLYNPNDLERTLTLDIDAVSSDLIRALRGNRSQVAFARRLGYKSNAIYTWESGRRWPRASVFLRAAERVGVDLRAGLASFLRDEPPWLDAPSSPASVAALLDLLRGDTPIGQVADRAGKSRFALSRWLSGAAEPRLPDFLRVIEATSLRLLDFVALFADPAELPSTREAQARRKAAQTVAWSSPWAQLVLLSLELAPYRALPAHDHTWLAQKLGRPAEEIESSITLLLRAGQIAFDGSHYVPVDVVALDVRSPEGARDLKRFWATLALERLEAGAEGLFSYNLVAVSAADLERLEEMHRAHYRAIRALVADSAPPERLALLQLHLLPLT